MLGASAEFDRLAREAERNETPAPLPSLHQLVRFSSTSCHLVVAVSLKKAPARMQGPVEAVWVGAPFEMINPSR
jgi:hypothetical protein